MTSETIFVAPPNQRAVLSALIDLSALGLLRPFGWINAPGDPGQAPDHHDPKMVWVKDGTLSLKSLGEVAHRHDVDGLNLILLVPLGLGSEEALSRDAESFYQERIGFSSRGSSNTRVLIPWTDSGEVEALGRSGWRNVLLSPEISRDPKFNGVPWWGDAPHIPGIVATDLAALGGLTGVVEATPFDGHSGFHSDRVQVVKTFSRITDGKEIENDLRSRVLALGKFYPAPEMEGSRTAIRPYPRPEAVTSGAADGWAHVHQPSLRSVREELPGPAQQQVSLGQALAWFFSFMKSALFGAPRRWLSDKTRALNTKIAQASTSMIFGDASGYGVVFGGITEDGKPVGWEEILSRVGKDTGSSRDPLAGAYQGEGSVNQGLWSDMVQGSLSLLDGSDYEPLGIRGESGYVANVDAVVPGPDEGTFVVDPKVSRVVPQPVLKAWDELAVSTAMIALKDASHEQGPQAAAADTELNRLSVWRERNFTRFVPRIGHYLADWFQRTYQEIGQHEAEISALMNSAQDAGLEAKQAKLGRILRVATAVAVFVLLLVGVLGWMKVIRGVDAGIVAGVVVVLWLISAIVVFALLQRDVFQARYRREAGAGRLEVLQGHLGVLEGDLRRIGDAYRQYLQWSSLLSDFTADPLGDQKTDVVSAQVPNVTPQNMEVATLLSDTKNIEDTAAVLRAASFGQGWLTAAWGAFRSHTSDYLNPDQRFRWVNNEIFMEADSGLLGSPLANWAKGVEERGVISSEGRRMWQECLQWVEYGRAADGHAVNLELWIDTDRGKRRAADHRMDLAAPHMGQTVAEIFSSDARVRGQHEVRQEYSWYAQAEDGLSSTMVLVQSTAPTADDGFVFDVRVEDQLSVADEFEY